MSSSTLWMRSPSATSRPRRRLSGSLSRSGMSTPSTLFGPTARTQSAATTLESTPPERPTTTPRRRRSFSTCRRTVSAMSSAAAAASILSTSSLKLIALASLRFRQHAAAADLAVFRLGKRLAEFDDLRHHEILQAPGAMPDYVALGVLRVGLEREHRLDRHAEHRVGHADHRGLAHARQLVEHVLDFLRADFLAA